MGVAVSIIVPVFNGIVHLDECISSILTQTLTDLEVLIVDDGSTDGSGEAADAYASKDSRVRVIHQKNSGVSAARNAALAVAVGEYIGFVDADDSADEEMFGALYSLAKKSGANIVCSGYRSYDGVSEWNTMPPFDEKEALDRDGIRRLTAQMHTRGSFLFIWRSIFSRKLIEDNRIRFDSSIAIGEDTLFCMECFLNAQRAVSINRTYYNYRLHPLSAMRKKYKPRLSDSLIAQYDRKLELCRGKFPEIEEEFLADAATRTAKVFWNILTVNIYTNAVDDKRKQLRKLADSAMFRDCFKHFDVNTLRTRSLDTIALCCLSKGHVNTAHILLCAAFKKYDESST